MKNCALCKLPEPADWCWWTSIDCPLKKPPRNVAVRELWGQIVSLRERVAALEALNRKEKP